MAEWSMAVVLKTTAPETVPGVRIPLPPPNQSSVIDSMSKAIDRRRNSRVINCQGVRERRHFTLGLSPLLSFFTRFLPFRSPRTDILDSP
jgi:hypothetical protein